MLCSKFVRLKAIHYEAVIYIFLIECMYWVFFKECPNGQFGMDCRKSCSGHCINNESCDHVSGVCPSGCHDGYTGIYCNNCNRFH